MTEWARRGWAAALDVGALASATDGLPAVAALGADHVLAEPPATIGPQASSAEPIRA